MALPDLVEQALRHGLLSAASQAGAHHCEQDGLSASVIFEMVCEVGIEGDAVAGVQRVAPAVADEHDLAGFDERGLAAARLVHRRVTGAAGRGARASVCRETSARCPGSGGVRIS